MSYTFTENHIPGRKITFEGKEYLWLGGTNYLNIGSHPTFQKALKEGIEYYSQNFGSSRRNNLQFTIGLFEATTRAQVSLASPPHVYTFSIAVQGDG